MDGQIIDYTNAKTGHLKIVPEGDTKAALAHDYADMLADEVTVGDTPTFGNLLDACTDVEAHIDRRQVAALQ